jgi:hypothetical protein
MVLEKFWIFLVSYQKVLEGSRVGPTHWEGPDGPMMVHVAIHGGPCG